MSCVLNNRRTSRQEDITKGLQFIQSSLPYFGLHKDYEIFIQKLVRDLFNEGNDLYREGCKNKSLNQYIEALSIADYACSEDICISNETLEKLHVNRAACYADMGFHEDALKDCDLALILNNSNFRAQYRKSKALFMLESYKEAYDAIARCSITAPQDESVVKLTQDLALKLGLKIRKAYVRVKPDLHTGPEEGARKVSGCAAEEIEPDLPELGYDSGSALSPLPPLTAASDLLSESVLVPASPLPPIIYPTAEAGTFRSAVVHNGTSSFPMACVSYRDGDILGVELDDILDSVPELDDFNTSSSALAGPLSHTDPIRSFPSALLDSLDSISPTHSFSLNSLGDARGGHMNGASALNTKATFPFPVNASRSLFGSDSPTGARMKTISDYLGNGTPAVSDAAPSNVMNPLEDTHEFRQACQLCFTKAGPKCVEYTYNYSLAHKCKKDILLGRIKSPVDKSWKRIRPRPIKTQYVGPFYICKDVTAGEGCTYPGRCTFAYCQEEIDVWTFERKGAFCREALFGGNGKVGLTVSHLLKEYQGIFMFLCEKCFDHKPRIISKENKDNPLYCSHPVSKHDFEDNKCLVHILKETTVKYYKIRPFNPDLVLDLCRHEVRYGCQREDECYYAHSLVELRVWMMQKDTGIYLDAIAQESKRCLAVEARVSGSQVLDIEKNPGCPSSNIKFVCGQCWGNGQVIVPDKNRKYCSAKARHPWTKERRVVLWMSNERKKWISIRPLPTKKPVPLQFDLCNHIVNGKKCQYIGNCTFAHSSEEKEMWTYMRENSIQDMEHLYEIWLKNQKVEKGETASVQANKQIHLPTDYAETTVDFHCWLCGKNCNSERQWKMHISSEKHKEKVFETEDDQNIWQHRFPGREFSLCESFLSGTCSEEDKCPLAHGNAELQEWEERRQVLCLKLCKARKDQLVAPDDSDFGKYSFLINDLN